ncbi:hypothetical protein RUM43_003104 [Polyplax serrata]|uniref:Oligopeptide transporter 1 n=1 Tax=Polyplax serrata TaxID=468196 RepID=A0AAN8S5D1_POLSC
MTVTKEKIPYPTSVFFIVSNEFCERFSFYGMRTILALYLKNQLEFTDNTATVIYHIFIMICYFFPLLGAIVADSWLGKFKTILYLSLVYALGNIVVSVAAIPNTLPPVAFTMIGLILIALGTGGIKPCVSAFGGDQFVLPEQEDQLQKFFSIFYFAINSGSFISTFLTPILREIPCFGNDNCYSLAFGVPAVLILLAIVIYFGGKKFYTIKKPEGNVVVKVAKCIWHGMTNKTTKTYDHWLDKAQDKYDVEFIEDVKAALRVLVLYIPLPIFWALFDQQGSRWTFQATRMNGELGAFKIQPDQMQVINPILILAFIPLFESVVYPLLAKCRLLTRPLQKLTVGGVLAAAAFFISAIVETQLEPTYAVLPKQGEGQVRFYNGLEDPVYLTIPELNVTRQEIKSLDVFESLNIKTEKQRQFQYEYEVKEKLQKETFQAYEKEATSYTFMSKHVISVQKENIDKSDNGNPKLMVILSEDSNYNQRTISLREKGTQKELYSRVVTSTKPYVEYSKVDLAGDTYTLLVDGKITLNDISMKQGGCYVALITKTSNAYKASVLTVTKPNTVHILWLIPQYVVITAGEIMFSITGLEFSFTQAPLSMKSLLQAAWLLTVAIGNLVVVIVAEAKIFDTQTYEFLLFGGLMLLDMFIFGIMAMRYKYVETLPKESSQPAVANNKTEDTSSSGL